MGLDVHKDLLFELGLNNGTRRIEDLRLSTKDAEICIKTGILTVRGKGPMGGKARSFRAHPNTPRVLEEFLVYRDRLLEKVRAPVFEEPKELLIYVKSNRAYPYKRQGLDKVLRVFSRRTGTHFSFHTLRRSFGRQMHLAGAPIQVIQKILGHESLEMTIRYLGLNIDDTTRAMEQLVAFQEKQGSKLCSLGAMPVK